MTSLSRFENNTYIEVSITDCHNYYFHLSNNLNIINKYSEQFIKIMLRFLNTNKVICIILLFIFEKNLCAILTDNANIKTIEETNNHDVLNLNKAYYLNFNNIVVRHKTTFKKRSKFEAYRRCRQRCQCRRCCRCESLLH